MDEDGRVAAEAAASGPGARRLDLPLRLAFNLVRIRNLVIGAGPPLVV